MENMDQQGENVNFTQKPELKQIIRKETKNPCFRLR